ncbi:MAG: CBS domain-containing protein [Planctomycetaceae bacterium]
MHQLTVLDLVRQESENIVSPALTIREAAERLIQSECDLLVVKDTDGKLAGVVSESSVVRSLLANNTESITVHSLIVAHAESVRLTSPVAEISHLFRASCNTALAVVGTDDRLAGILLRRDVMAAMLEALATDGKESKTGSAESFVSQSNVGAAPAAPADQHTRQSAASDNVEDSIHRVEPADESTSQPGKSGPYFLRGKDARKRLNQADDGFRGYPEQPW